MYGYEWTEEYGIYRLVPNAKVIKEIRPVFKEELDYFGLGKYWQYPNTDAPLLWAEGIRRYNLNGECIAEAVGGGFYTKPTIEIKTGYDKSLELKPVDINALWRENERLMLGLEKTAVEFIRKVHDEYEKRGMKFVVAFSGGKDSLVLLDLVAKALRPDEFVVIFSNTGMELSVTLEAVERAKNHWEQLKPRFYEASSHMTPDETWEAFGPPGRRLRWCCSVHKSVPTILKLREITGDYEAKAIVFEGIRAEESLARSEYETVREGVKNINQVNVSPILSWGTAEIFLYLLRNNILLNNAYKEGFNRVGCSVCPSSSPWRDHMSYGLYKEELKPLFSKIEKYASFISTNKAQRKFIEDGRWKGRIGGYNIANGGNRIDEIVNENAIMYRFERIIQMWLEVCKILGKVVEKNDNTYVQIIEHRSYVFTLTEDAVTYSPYSIMDRFIISRLRGVANKVAYCVGCKACVVQCPSGAFEITTEKKIKIREERCTHCANCISFTAKGCLVAMTLHSTIGGVGMKMKGMDSKYKTFGFRRSWLEHFFDNGIGCFNMGQLGSVQYYALKFWLTDAGLLTSAKKGEKIGVPTQLCNLLCPLGAGNPLVWAIIWTNLAYTSVIARWYMLCTHSGETYDKGDLVFMLGDDYSLSTRDNAIAALLETLRHSPIGAVLKQGIPIPDGASFKYIKQGWDSPEAIAILYALYKYAEETGKYTTTLTALENARGNTDARGVDPVSIFGLNPAKFKDILQEIAIAYPGYLRVVFQLDLDNIVLVPERKSIDILCLVAE